MQGDRKVKYEAGKESRKTVKGCGLSIAENYHHREIWVPRTLESFRVALCQALGEGIRLQRCRKIRDKTEERKELLRIINIYKMFDCISHLGNAN